MLRKLWLTKKLKLRVFILNLIRFSIDESILNKLFFEHFKQMFRKLKLIEKSKSHDVNFIFEEFENTIQTACIFDLKNLHRLN